MRLPKRKQNSGKFDGSIKTTKKRLRGGGVKGQRETERKGKTLIVCFLREKYVRHPTEHEIEL